VEQAQGFVRVAYTMKGSEGQLKRICNLLDETFAVPLAKSEMGRRKDDAQGTASSPS